MLGRLEAAGPDRLLVAGTPAGNLLLIAITHLNDKF
jgi:hypothetical protein